MYLTVLFYYLVLLFYYSWWLFLPYPFQHSNGRDSAPEILKEVIMKMPQMKLVMLEEITLIFCHRDENLDYNSKPQSSHYLCYDLD